MKLTISLAVFLLLFICIACAQVSTKTENTSYLNDIAKAPLAAKRTDDCITMDFHYPITSDNQASPNTRQIEVFLDEKGFSEENLKKLFRYLSDKNPDPNNSPNNLILKVNTDWKQLGFPSDCPGVGVSGGITGTDVNDYHWARFYRREEKEFFTYNPTKKVWKNKDVLMKGNKIFRNGKWQEPQ